MTWLKEGYAIPKAENNYLKLEDGNTKFRIVSKPIIGYVAWTEEKKPLRKKDNDFSGVRLQEGTSPKHFWAMVVWNYEDEKTQILEITQKTIMKAIQRYASNPDWGTPLDYDITITRSGQKLNTEYALVASPKKDLSADVLSVIEENKVNLEALFTGEDPFLIKQDAF